MMDGNKSMARVVVGRKGLPFRVSYPLTDHLLSDASFDNLELEHAPPVSV